MARCIADRAFSGAIDWALELRHEARLVLASIAIRKRAVSAGFVQPPTPSSFARRMSPSGEIAPLLRVLSD